MEKTVKMKDVYAWLSIMGNPQEYDRVNMFYRFAGAADLLSNLGLITWKERNKLLDEYISKYIAETGA